MELPTDKEISELNAEYIKKSSEEFARFKEVANKAIRNGYYNGLSFVEFYITSFDQPVILKGIKWLEDNGYKSARVSDIKEKRGNQHILKVTLKKVPNG